MTGLSARAQTFLLTTSAALLLVAIPQASRAGILQPLLEMMRPRMEAKISESCTELVREVSGGLDGVSLLAEGPCRSAAKPISACLVREAGHSHRELQMITELLRGQIGDDSRQVIRRCLSSMMGLPANGLDQLLPNVLLKQRR
ncbi:MAG: hypothetical protein VKK03_09910 [Synechococcus sp.]|nr:hypothetical protein [Synechococcus sp.]